MGGQLGLESRTPGLDPAPIRTAEVTAATIAALKVVEVEVNRSRPRRYSQAASRAVVPLHHVSQWVNDSAGRRLAGLKSVPIV